MGNTEGWTYYFASLKAPPGPGVSLSGASLDVRYEPSGGGSRGPGPFVLKPGQVAVGRLTLVTTEALPESTVHVPIPAGAMVVDPGQPLWHPSARSTGRLRFPALPVLEVTQRSSSLWLQVDALPPGIHEYRWAIGARFAGRFLCPPVTLRRASDERLVASASACDALHVP